MCARRPSWGCSCFVPGRQVSTVEHRFGSPASQKNRKLCLAKIPAGYDFNNMQRCVPQARCGSTPG